MIEQIKKGDNVFLFGCGDLGKYAKKVFDHYGIDIAGYLSSRIPESGKFEGKPVWQPGGVSKEKKYSDAYVGICVFSDAEEKKIELQLRELGFWRFIDKNWIINAYLSQGLKPLGLKRNSDKISAYFTLHITDYCSLRCKYCGAFSPYVANPRHYSVEECVRPIKRMLQVVDEIKFLTIQGGEPFLHPELTAICEEIVSLEQVKEIRIPSNATVLPKEDFFKRLTPYRKKISIRVSDYGILNNKYDVIKQLCEKYGFQIEKILVNGGWEKPKLPLKYNRTEEENQNLYMTCESCGICPFMVDGRLYKCETAGIWEHMGWLPHSEEDSIDFYDDTISIEQLRENVIKFITSVKAIDACDYCNMICESVEKAEQITEKNWSIENLRAGN